MARKIKRCVLFVANPRKGRKAKRGCEVDYGPQAEDKPGSPAPPSVAISESPPHSSPASSSVAISESPPHSSPASKGRAK